MRPFQPERATRPPLTNAPHTATTMTTQKLNYHNTVSPIPISGIPRARNTDPSTPSSIRKHAFSQRTVLNLADGSVSPPSSPPLAAIPCSPNRRVCRATPLAGQYVQAPAADGMAAAQTGQPPQGTARTSFDHMHDPHVSSPSTTHSPDPGRGRTLSTSENARASRPWGTASAQQCSFEFRAFSEVMSGLAAQSLCTKRTQPTDVHTVATVPQPG